MTNLGILVAVFLVNTAIILHGMGSQWPFAPHQHAAQWDLRMTNLFRRWRRHRRVRRSPLRNPLSWITGRR